MGKTVAHISIDTDIGNVFRCVFWTAAIVGGNPIGTANRQYPMPEMTVD
jgi:hypothetical protein